tara:strand:- start:94 stop:327 length:234 start_codon:yes stop_codon:yes gene_type:complete
MSKASELIKSMDEASDVYKDLRKSFPQTAKMVGQVSKSMQWDVGGARSFCLHLLEDVNDHTMVKKLDKLFNSDLVDT